MPEGPSDVPLPIAGFLSWLRAQGFAIGVDSHLRVQQLLERAGPECSPADLKTVLCPLFARSEEQQDAFYRSFDRWFDLFAAPAAPDSTREREPAHPPPSDFKHPPTSSRWRYAAAAGLLLAAVVTFSVINGTRPSPRPVTSTVNTAPDTHPAAPLPQTGKSGPDAPPNAVPLPLQPAPQPQPQPPTSPLAKSSFWKTHQAASTWVVEMAFVLLILLWELNRLLRRRHVLQKQQGRKGPFSWPVRIPSRPTVYHSAPFYAAARRLQRRQRGESLTLDVDGSVEATIHSLGFPTFQYKPDSRLPEYLVLIDRNSMRDHQSNLFESLSLALEGEGLFATILFFDGDPRVCQTAAMDASFYLVDLERRHAADRLIVFGDGEKLIDAVTGRLAGWAALFQSWNDRAVLTPVAPSAWGLTEKTLAAQFIVLPASVDGLLALVDHFEQSSQSDIRSWRQKSGEPPVPDLVGPLLVPRLREYLGAPAFDWLCACAVYPELHWDLTLYLGSIPGAAENPINETNLLRLIRLPWFRLGSIPDEVRWALIQELEPARQTAVRHGIIQLLEENPPPRDSLAGDLRDFQIVFQRYCLNRRDRQRRRALVEALKSLPQTELLRDYTTLSALESMRLTALDFVLPRAMRRLLFANGLPAFGLKDNHRLLVVVPVCLLLGFFSTASFWKKNHPSLSAAHAPYAGRCEVCHAQPSAPVQDQACEKCHDGSPHPAKLFDTAKATSTLSCAGCHVEHRGQVRLSEVANGNCTQCHAELVTHGTGVSITGVAITAFRAGKHPEFSTVSMRDTRPLQLNHSKHMTAQPGKFPGLKMPMKCEDCHQMDPNSPAGSLMPVTFEKDCKSCHSRELQFDRYQVLGANAIAAPHIRDAGTIRNFVWAAYSKALAADPTLSQKSLGRDLVPQPNAAWLEKVTADSIDYLFQQKCTFCHQMASHYEVQKVDSASAQNPGALGIIGRFPDGRPWLERGEFSHRSHNAVQCESCHTTARSSTRTEDVLIPGMKSCLPCHDGSRAGLDRCSECHLYHNPSLQKRPTTRPQ